jgi:hypothetical protein
MLQDMKTAGWIRLLALAALMSAACSSAPAPSASVATPSSAATTTSSPLQPGQCQASSNPCLALVTLRGSSQLVVRDITDINHPKTVSNLGPIPLPQFVGMTDISYADAGGLVRVPLAGSPKTLVAKTSQVMLFDWSPDGGTAAYITNASDKSELHLVTGGQNRVVSSMQAFNGGCETQACAKGSDFRLGYSQDGRFISLTQPWGGPNFRLWNSEGKLLKSNNPGTSYAMSTWSGNGLYFLDPSGVVVWRNGVVSSFLPGVNWLRPKGSPGGGQIVYAAVDKSGSDHTYVVDTSTQKVRELKNARSEPIFLTSRYIWYQGERSCAASDPCDGTLPVIANGKTYIYDLQDGTETESLITSVADVWPHAA